MLNYCWLIFQILLMICSPYTSSQCSQNSIVLLFFLPEFPCLPVKTVFRFLLKPWFLWFPQPRLNSSSMLTYLSTSCHTKNQHTGLQLFYVSLPPLWVSWKQRQCSIDLRSFCSLSHLGISDSNFLYKIFNVFILYF